MTALALDNLAAVPALVRSLRAFFVRLAGALDALVSARAARAVPEWQMQEVQAQIARLCNLIQTADSVAQSKIEPVSASSTLKRGISNN